MILTRYYFYFSEMYCFPAAIRKDFLCGSAFPGTIRKDFLCGSAFPGTIIAAGKPLPQFIVSHNLYSSYPIWMHYYFVGGVTHRFVRRARIKEDADYEGVRVRFTG